MYYHRIDIPTKAKSIKIVPIGDIHNGNPYSDTAKATKFRDYVLNTPDTYTIDMGDDMDNVVLGSKGEIYDQQQSPHHQFKETIKFWKPVAKAGKLLAIMDDNHTYRSRALADWHIVEDICEKLDARYGGFGCFLDLRIGAQQYTIYCLHGRKGGTTDSGVLNTLVKMNQRVVADIYLRGHNHRKIVHQDEVKKLTKFGLMEHKRSYGVTGSFMSWDNSYAERSEYLISVRGCIKLELFADHWDVHISL